MGVYMYMYIVYMYTYVCMYVCIYGHGVITDANTYMRKEYSQ